VSRKIAPNIAKNTSVMASDVTASRMTPMPVQVCGAPQTDDGREEACRKRGKAEGKIALDEIGGQ